MTPQQRLERARAMLAELDEMRLSMKQNGLYTPKPVRRIQWPTPTRKQPSDRTLEKWAIEDGVARATDGCRVEPDGVCPHGHPSWLLKLGMI